MIQNRTFFFNWWIKIYFFSQMFAEISIKFVHLYIRNLDYSRQKLTGVRESNFTNVLPAHFRFKILHFRLGVRMKVRINDTARWEWDEKKGVTFERKNEKFHSRCCLICSIHGRWSIIFLVGEMSGRATGPTTDVFHCGPLTSNALICN